MFKLNYKSTLVSLKKACCKTNGRGPPTSPTLRPRVLTPRDHFAHRGGGRRRILLNGRQKNQEEFGSASRQQPDFVLATPTKNSLTTSSFRSKVRYNSGPTARQRRE